MKIATLPGVLEETAGTTIHQAPVTWIYCGRFWEKYVIKYLRKLNKKVSEQEEDSPPENFRLLERNIFINVDLNMDPSHTIDIIRHQNEYFTSVSYKHLVFSLHLKRN